MFNEGLRMACEEKADFGLLRALDPSELHELSSLFMALELNPAYDHGRFLCAMNLHGNNTACTVGWVSPLANVGDFICCLGGMPTPIVLRPTESVGYYEAV